MDPLTILAGANAGVGLINSLFGSNTTQTTQSGFDDYRNPQIMSAINQLLQRGQTGFGTNLLSRLKAGRRDLFGTETSGLRASAASRLQRQGVPVQVQEQILGDISQKGMQQLSSVLDQLDFMNEEEKLKALTAAGGLSKGLTRKWKSKGTQPVNNAGGIGDSLAFLMLAGGGNNWQMPNPYSGDEYDIDYGG